MKHLVIGLGQIGKALLTVLQSKFDAVGIDVDATLTDQDHYSVIHICFPYSPAFVSEVNRYRQYLVPGGLVVIHSTLPVGTAAQCGDAVHSPVRGIHPNLESGIRTFTKYFGGQRAPEAAAIFADLGVTTMTTPRSQTTEALKLWDTTVYAWNVILEKEIWDYCKTNDVDYELIYSHSNQTYNDGYNELGHPEYCKYVLSHMDGKIGGHCLVPNAKLLNSWVADVVLKQNETYE